MAMMVDNFECAGYTFYSKFDSGNLGKVELVRCCEGLGIVGNTVSNAIGAGGVTCGAGAGSNAPVIGSGNNTASGTGITSASAIVAATLGIGLQQQHHGLLSSTTGNGNGGSTTGSVTSTLGLPIPSPTPHATENPLVEVEFNLWTRPDCGGTPYENQNRTWFHFAVTGGRPNQIVKFNVMNLNKQAKLFSQGMHPVTKVGPNGRWERIKDKPSYSITNDVFFISFLHKVPEVGGDQTRIYYAFTFPFTYTELLDQLASFDRKFGRHPFELNKMAYEISQKYDALPATATEESKNISNLAPHRRKGKLSKMERVDRTSPESFDETARDGVGHGPPIKEALSEANKSLQTVLGPGAGGMIIDENTSESMQQITNLVNKVKIELPSGGSAGGETKQPAQASSSTCSTKTKLPSFHHQLNVASTTANLSEEDPRDEIYYCRELLTHSIERRRIELLTISSFHRIQTARELRLRNLFPDDEAQRCHTFKDKKIVFISSRVHPGETPASFVLNGFLSMLLDRKSVVAQTLRRMYVFKIIPFLNPDGVYNGLYRSDTRGHNLNRVYISPCHETQPAIYAARKLIRYYHLGVDEVEPYELEKEAVQANATVDVKEIVIDPAAVPSPIEGITSTDATGGNVNVALKKGIPSANPLTITRRNSTQNANPSSATTITTVTTTTNTAITTTNTTHIQKMKLPKLTASVDTSKPSNGSSVLGLSASTHPVKRLSSTMSFPVEGSTRKRRTPSLSSTPSTSVSSERRSVIAFVTPSEPPAILANRSKPVTSWSDKIFGKILRRRRTKSVASDLSADGIPAAAGKLSPIAQALPKPTLLLPVVEEETSVLTVKERVVSSSTSPELSSPTGPAHASTTTASNASSPLTDGMSKKGVSNGISSLR